MNMRISIEKVDNGWIVSGGPVPSDRNPLAQGPEFRRVAGDKATVLAIIDIYALGPANNGAED